MKFLGWVGLPIRNILLDFVTALYPDLNLSHIFHFSQTTSVNVFTLCVKFSRNKRKRKPIGMLGRSSGNHDWLLVNASACVSLGFRLRNARNASDCVWMETGLNLRTLPLLHFLHVFRNDLQYAIDRYHIVVTLCVSKPLRVLRGWLLLGLMADWRT